VLLQNGFGLLKPLTYFLKINLEREKNDHSQSKEETNQSSSSE
jgi:hypothetical protein